MKTGYNISNEMSINFIHENPIVAIPYLIVICAFTLSGCVGNTMVIGAVLTYKVSSILSYLTCYYFNLLFVQFFSHKLHNHKNETEGLRPNLSM